LLSSCLCGMQARMRVLRTWCWNASCMRRRKATAASL
jgi:hypothetical protein